MRQDRWSVYTYNQESGTAIKRRTCRLLKEAEAMAEMYLRCCDVDAAMLFDGEEKREKRSYGYFPIEIIARLEAEARNDSC